MLDQGLAKKTQANQKRICTPRRGHLCNPSRDGVSRKPRALLCKPSRDVDSRKLRALLCKPSRDVDSRKLRALLCKPSRDGVHANQGHLCKLDRYTRKPEYKPAWHSLEKERKGHKARIRTKIKTADKNSTGSKEAYQVTPIPVPHPSGGQPTPLPPTSSPAPPPPP
jgi:hypothetical protein